MNETFDRKYAENILPEKVEKYMKELEEDVKISETNIHDKTLLKPSIAAKWARFYYEEEHYKAKIADKINELKNKVGEQLLEKKRNAIVSQTINETMIKIETDKVVKKMSQYIILNEELIKQDEVLRLINDARQIISQMGFDLKNSIDILKLENI